MAFVDAALSPWGLLEGALAVYTVSSQLGFEAILSGHRPVVFGQPFYAGWGLSDDRDPLDRRQRKLTRAQLFVGAMILYPTWYCPYRDRLCTLEEAIDTLDARARAWREDRAGWVASGMRLWKRTPLQQFYGRYRKLRFAERRATAIAAKDQRRHMVWASAAADHPDAVRVEDGFLRSRGLGADLTAPLSLVTDPTGIYYDPSAPSQLEILIENSADLPHWATHRAERLIARVLRAKLGKYNTGTETGPADLPQGRRILVPGQVEDDASIRLGTTDVRTNRDLLIKVREANPAAVILYKPHPDVEAGLRIGAVPDALDHSDSVLDGLSADAAIGLVDEVWTMTSTIGFEALLRGKKVVTLGSPFYAGWGLTDDHAMPLTRRQARPTIAQMAHAVLIDYPRYFDPVSGEPCPPEVAVERLSSAASMLGRPAWRLVAKVQGLFASYAWIWR